MASAKKNNHPAKTAVRKRKNGTTTTEQLARSQAEIGSWIPAPGDLVRRFRDEVDHLLEEFGFENVTRSLPSTESLGLGIWAPPVEVFEREGQIVVRADLPGLAKDDVKVDLSESAITISGHRNQEREESGQDYYRTERSYGSFHRRIPLPRGVEIDTARAQFRNGVLEITMAAPEVKERQARKLEIDGEPISAKARAAGR